MAIVDIDKSYIKIDYTHSGVIGGSIQVAFATYTTIEERNKEKQREEQMSLFLQQVYARISKLQEEAIQKWGSLSPTEIEQLQSTAEFINWQQDIENYQHTYTTFGEYAYKVVGGAPEYNLFLSKEELDSLNFNIQWFEDPVVHNGFTTINCGPYDNVTRPELTMEFFYNKLKEKMNPEVLDA